MTSTTVAVATEDAGILGEALGVPHGRIRPVSREPLGRGSVAGLHVAEGDGDPLLYYLDTSRLAVRQETGLVAGDLAAPEMRIWLHPADPHLPALPAVAFAEAAASLLARIGIAATGAPEMVGYRPGRRAVLRIGTEAGPMWLKVVRPSRVERIGRAHAGCRRAGLPVPEVLAWSPEGVLLIADAVGRPASEAPWEPEELLDGVDALRERIAAVETVETARGAAGRMDWYATCVAGSARAERLLATARGMLSSAGPRPHSVVHGDLHLGQLFIDDRRGVSGLVDVDTLGRGDAAEDPAAFLAHAVASALIAAPSGRERLWRLADAGFARWGADAVVRALAGAHLLGHACGAADRSEQEHADRLLRAAAAVLASRSPSEAGVP